jgi:hypothetical protein
MTSFIASPRHSFFARSLRLMPLEHVPTGSTQDSCRTLGALPSPTNPGLPGLVRFMLPEASKPAAGWGGVGGGGSSWRRHLAQQQRPPSPALPQRKSGLPDLRKISRDPGRPGARGGGSRPRLLLDLVPFQRDTLYRESFFCHFGRRRQSHIVDPFRDRQSRWPRRYHICRSKKLRSAARMIAQIAVTASVAFTGLSPKGASSWARSSDLAA